MATTAAFHHPSREDIRLVDVMHALGHPIRMQIVCELVNGEETSCGAIDVDVPKSTLTSHWRILREAGVIYQRPEGRKVNLTLRRDDLDARFPGLLALIFSKDAPAPNP